MRVHVRVWTQLDASGAGVAFYSFGAMTRADMRRFKARYRTALDDLRLTKEEADAMVVRAGAGPERKDLERAGGRPFTPVPSVGARGAGGSKYGFPAQLEVG